VGEAAHLPWLQRIHDIVPASAVRSRFRRYINKRHPKCAVTSIANSLRWCCASGCLPRGELARDPSTVVHLSSVDGSGDHDDHLTFSNPRLLRRSASGQAPDDSLEWGAWTVNSPYQQRGQRKKLLAAFFVPARRRTLPAPVLCGIVTSNSVFESYLNPFEFFPQPSLVYGTKHRRNHVRRRARKVPSDPSSATTAFYGSHSSPDLGVPGYSTRRPAAVVRTSRAHIDRSRRADLVVARRAAAGSGADVWFWR
jgi:hypothetical protein